MKLLSRKTTRRLALAGTGVFAVSATAFVAANALADDNEAGVAVPVNCSIELLPTPDDAVSTQVTAMDSTGTFIGGFYVQDADEPDHRLPVIWENGELVEIEFDEELEFDRASVADINSEGFAVLNVGDVQNTTPYAFDGERTYALANSDSYAHTVNDDGEIAGYSRLDAMDIAVVFGEDSMAPLGAPNREWGASGIDIDEAGTIFGYHYGDPIEGRAPYLWHSDDSIEALQMPDGIIRDNMDGGSINNGWVVGNITYRTEDGEDSGSMSLMWDSETGEPESIDIDTASDVSSEGIVAGKHDGVAAVYANGELTELPNVHGDESGLEDLANAISGDGTVIAGTVNWSGTGNYDHEAAFWSCG